LKKFDLAIGGGQSTPKAHGVASASPIRPVWGYRSHPMALGGALATPNGQINFFKKICLAGWGWSNHPRAISKTTKKSILLFYFIFIKNIIFFIFHLNIK
jgi:hypothetical protein